MSIFTFPTIFLLIAGLLIIQALKQPAHASLLAIQRTSAKRRRADNLPLLKRSTRLRVALNALFLRPLFNYETVPVMIRNQVVSIDHRLANVIARLNENNIQTTHCCQGCHTPGELKQSALLGLHDKEAYLKVAATTEFPRFLISAVVHSGLAWRIGNHSITTVAAYAHRAELFAINQVFVQLLEDWATGVLDGSGTQYRCLYERVLETALEGERMYIASNFLQRICSVLKSNSTSLEGVQGTDHSQPGHKH